MASKGKRTFWVSAAPTALHHERITILGQNGFDIVLISGLNDLLRQNIEQRASCVFIDTPNNDNAAGIQTIQQLSMMPEMNGARFVLMATQPSPEAFRVAVSENFRDIIPMNLETSAWLQRIQFATGAKPSEFSAPLCEISMNQVAVAMAPARIVWINETHIRIECRGSQRVGSSLQISGNISEVFGAPHLSLTVESIHKDQLQFRFSQALVCRWRVAASSTERASTMIRRLQQNNLETKLRAFAAISKADIRKTVVANLSPTKFDVKVGLQRGTVAQEFRYFSPDVVYMDDKIFAHLTESELQEMFTSVPSDVPLVIYGARPDQARVTKNLANRTIFVESEANPDHLQNSAQRYRLNTHAMSAKHHDFVRPIAADHPWSKIEIHVPARLISLNPLVGEISLPYSMGNFTMAKLEAPILRKALGRDPYIKITDTSEAASSLQANQFTHHANFYLADVDCQEQVLLTNTLTTMLNNYYQKQFVAPSQSAAINRTVIPISAASISTMITTRSAPLVSLGNLAAKEPLIAATKDSPDGPQISLAPETIHTKLRREFFKPEIELDLSFDWRKKIDMTIVKAIGLFAVAIGITALIISMAVNIDESYYKEHGREYSNFFQRMTNPEFRKANPAPGLEKLNRDRDRSTSP